MKQLYLDFLLYENLVNAKRIINIKSFFYDILFLNPRNRHYFIYNFLFENNERIVCQIVPNSYL